MLLDRLDEFSIAHLKRIFGNHLIRPSEKTFLKYSQKIDLGSVEISNQLLIRNLGRVDTILPVLLSELIAKKITMGMENWSDLLDHIDTSESVEKLIGIKFSKDHLRYVTKKLLLALAGGMNSDELWIGQYAVLHPQSNIAKLNAVEKDNFTTLADALFKFTKLEVFSYCESLDQGANFKGDKSEAYGIFGIKF